MAVTTMQALSAASGHCLDWCCHPSLLLHHQSEKCWHACCETNQDTEKNVYTLTVSTLVDKYLYKNEGLWGLVGTDTGQI